MQLLRRGKMSNYCKLNISTVIRISLTMKTHYGIAVWRTRYQNERFQSAHSALFSVNAQDYSKEKGQTDDNYFHIIRRR